MATSTLQLPIYGLKVQHEGQGRPLLFLHGAGGLAQFGAMISSLAKTRAVFAPTHPGFDGTPSPEWLDAIDDVALLYLDLVERLGDDPIDIVGFSVGGWIGFELAILAGKKVRSVTVIGAPGMSVPGISIPDNFLWDADHRLKKLIHNQALADRLSALPIDEAEEVRRIQNWNALAKLAWSPRWFSPRLDKWHHRLSMPVQLIWGAQDQLFPSALGQAYRDRLPNARFATIPDCGHLVHLEAPEAAESLIVNFLGELDA